MSLAFARQRAEPTVEELRRAFAENPVAQTESVPHARQAELLYSVKGARQVRWAHAVNSLELLNGVCKDRGGVHMVEADACTSPSDPDAAVMAHDPGAPGDGVDAFVRALHASNIHASRNDRQPPLGLKLDMKDAGAVRASLRALEELQAERKEALETPLWLNADVLRGPGGGEPGIDADRFVAAALQSQPHAVLSLGWTTGGATSCSRYCGAPAGACWWAPARDTEGGRYTPSMVDEMIDLCERYSLHQVTFPVRYSAARGSLPEMQRLLNHCPSYSLTVWHGAGDTELPDVDWIDDNLPASRVFLDAGNVPTES